MVNARIRQLSNDICDLLNGYTDIPIEVKRLVISNLLIALDRESEKAIQSEIESLAKEKVDE